MATTTSSRGSRGLGKGLSALISENYVQPPASGGGDTAIDVKEQPATSLVNVIPVGKLHTGNYQPRRRFNEMSLTELSESIARNGIMQPIIVRPSNKQAGKFEIIAGERRWRAAKMAGLDEVPTIVRDITDKQALEFALIENIQRQDLSPLEEAIGFQRLIEEFEYTQEELADVVGKSRSHIANLLRLQTLPDEVKEFLDRGEISMGHARALLTAANPLQLAQEIVKKGLNVRQTEKWSKGAGERKPRAKRQSRGGEDYLPPVNKDPDILALEESLSENLGLRVSINDRGQSGEIILSYDSLTQLDNILQRLGNSV